MVCAGPCHPHDTTTVMGHSPRPVPLMQRSSDGPPLAWPVTPRAQRLWPQNGSTKTCALRVTRLLFSLGSSTRQPGSRRWPEACATSSHITVELSRGGKSRTWGGRGGGGEEGFRLPQFKGGWR